MLLTLINALEAADLDSSVDFDAGAQETLRTLRALSGQLGGQDAYYQDLVEAVEAGADCASLFDLRDRIDKKHPNAERADELLRSVGCSSRGSTRSP